MKNDQLLMLISILKTWRQFEFHTSVKDQTFGKFMLFLCKKYDVEEL